MRKLALSFGFLVGAVALSFSSVAAQAQSIRTWVSGDGNDANPCSRSAPCQTFAGAIGKTAVNGAIDCLGAGGFGAVTIVKWITIDCHEVFAGISAGGVNAIVVNITGSAATDPLRTVRIRNLRIDGAGNGTRSGLVGIKILSAASVVIEDTLIQNFTQGGISVAPTAAGSTDVTIHDSVISENAGGGLVITAPGGRSVTATLDNVRFTGNLTAGISVTNTTPGTAVVNVTDSQIENGPNFGVRSVGASALVRLADSAVTGNATGLSAVTSGQIISLRNNVVLGNTADGAFSSTLPLK